MTLKYIWRSFSLGCYFHVHFSYFWHAFASHGLPAIAELLVKIATVTSNNLLTFTTLYPTINSDACTFPGQKPTFNVSCSASSTNYSVPRTRTKFGDRAFSVAGPVAWNSLPAAVRESDSLYSFKRKLKTHLFRPPVRSNGRSYKMLVMFLFFRCQISELPRPIAAKLCRMIGTCVNFINWLQKFRELSPLRNWGPKTCKISVDFIQRPNLIANISGTAQDIQNLKTNWSTAIPPALHKKGPVNFGPLITETKMWVWTH